jgi:alpha-tubulin suppressor-like RCC1 family protein
MSTHQPPGPSERQLLAGPPPVPPGITLPTGRLPRRRTGRRAGTGRPVRLLLVAVLVLVGATACNGLAFGSNVSGQLGVGDTTVRPAPAAVTGGITFRSVDAGDAHTCGIAQAGTLHCWGKGGDGRLGVGPLADATRPTQVGTAADWVQVSAGFRHSCGIRGEGRVFCWGNNDLGQAVPAVDGDRATPHEVFLAGDTNASVSAGKEHSCAVQADGDLVCWGRNDDRRLGAGPPAAGDLATVVPGRWAAVSAGIHTCGIAAPSGALLCWGRNGRGQLGDQSHQDAPSPRPVAFVGGWDEVEVGDEHTCGRRGGDLLCWGSNDRGQLGIAGVSETAAPASVDGALDYRDVSVGAEHACGVRLGGHVSCWGANASGQLGDSTTVERRSPTPIVGSGDPPVRLVAAGGRHTVVLRAP